AACAPNSVTPASGESSNSPPKLNAPTETSRPKASRPGGLPGSEAVLSPRRGPPARLWYFGDFVYWPGHPVGYVLTGLLRGLAGFGKYINHGTFPRRPIAAGGNPVPQH